MSLADQLFSNPIIRNTALGTLKKVMRSEGLKTITIKWDEDGEDISINAYREDMHQVTPEAMAKFQNAILKTLSNGD